jgi:hypothetical protein
MFNGTISFDPCSNEFSMVHAETELRLPEHDGLYACWDHPTIYVNPPYGADRNRGTTIKHWIARCADAHQNFRSEVLALIPVATNTTHWKDYIFGKASAICFLYDTRLRFLVNGKDEGKGAPMSCAMVYWGKHIARFYAIFIKYGAVVSIVNLQHIELEKRTKKKQKLLFA